MPLGVSTCDRLGGRGRRHVDQRRVAGARVGHHAGLQIDDRIGHGDEAAAVEVVGDDPVHLDQQLRAATW